MNKEQDNKTTSHSVLPVVTENSELCIHFSLSLMDATIVEQTEENQPMCFKMGAGSLIHNLEEMLIGLEQGTSAKMTLSPERAFGLPAAENVQTMSRDDFPNDIPLQEGHVIGFTTPTGEEVPGTVKRLGETDVDIDFNHPLAGATVIFDVTIIEVLS